MLMQQVFINWPIPQPWELLFSSVSASLLDSANNTPGNHVGLKGLGEKEEVVVVAVKGDTELEPRM